MNKKRIASAGLLAILLMGSGAALALTCTSTGTGNWNNPAIWSGCGGGVPGAGDTVIIGNVAHIVTVTDNRTATALQFAAGNQVSGLTINGGVTLTITGSMTVTGQNGGSGVRRVDVLAGGQLAVGNDLILVGGSNDNRDVELRLGNGAATAVTIGGDFGGSAAGANFSSTARVAITFLGQGTISIGRNFGGNSTLTSGTGTIVANGSVNQSLGAYNTAASNYYNLTVSKSGGTATFAGNALIRGDITDNGNFNPAAGNRTITLAGTAAQNLLGSAAGTTFYRVTLINGNGLNLAHDLNITNLLTLTTGRIVTGASRVYIQNGSAISSAGGADFVVGNLAKNYPTGANLTRVFEVGTLTGGARYAPVNIRFGSVTAAGDFTVSGTAGDHPNIGTSTIDAAQSVNRYWTLVNNSVTFAANANNRIIYTFVNPGDLDVGADPTVFFVSRYNAPTWTEITPTGRTATTTTISGAGITTANIAGDYQIGEQRPPITAPGSFNAFETSTAAGAITGVIRTRIAGTAFSLDVVAILAGAQQVTFTDAVIVELLGNTALGTPLDASNCPTSFTLVQTVAPNPTITGGRSTVSFAAVPNAWRDVRVRVRWPTSAPTVTSCSTDNFAIRPASFASFAITDTDWENAGTGRSLNDTAFGAVTHKAGRPFSVRADAVNSAAVITGNYAGTPGATPGACGPGAGFEACTATFGTLSLNTTFSSGQLISDIATYDEVGSFELQLVDSTFASVDSGDSTPLEREITSTVINVGRFVPDHFDVSVTTAPVLGTACGSFSYAGQSFGYTLQPVFTVTAQDFANSTTTLYAGNWWRITNSTLTPATQAARYSAASGTLDASGLPAVAGDPAIAAGAGSGTLTFGSGTGLSFTRGAPVSPFDADISLAVNVIDADGVAYASNPARFGQATPGNGIPFNNGNAMRFGRLGVGNANGSQLVPLLLPMETQYWNGTSFVTNAADNCTAVAAANVGLGNYTGNLGAGETTVTVSGAAFSSGRNTIALSAPGAGNDGSVDVVVNLGTTTTIDSCLAWGAMPTPAGANLTHLRGQWCGATPTKDPTARAAFGVYRGSEEVIFIRENF